MQTLQKVSRSRNGCVLHPILLAALASLAALLAPCHALAIIYDIDRSFSFSGGSFTATLTGTVDLPAGSYTISNKGPSPFTSANLTLTVNGTPYSVDSVVTTSISGSGEFYVNATATSLTFSTVNADGGDPADLVFTDNPGGGVNAIDRYAIGTDGAGSFEAAYTGVGGGYVADVVFPTEWGIAIPEPSILSLLTIPFAFLGFRVIRARKQVA